MRLTGLPFSFTFSRCRFAEPVVFALSGGGYESTSIGRVGHGANAVRAGVHADVDAARVWEPPCGFLFARGSSVCMKGVG